jgi:threonine dehydratase
MTETSSKKAISIEDVQAAAGRIAGIAHATPLIESSDLNEAVGGRVLVKPECLQRTGSFKFRGAYNRLSQLNGDERKHGVVAWSSGNHAQGIAAAAQILGVPAVIVMPKDAPKVKVENTLNYGAEIIPYDRYTQSREDIGRALAKERGAVLVPSYDDPDIIAGQGTTGLEIAQQAADLNCTLDSLLVCCGGGGLIAGVATAFETLSPQTDVFAVEPAGFDDHARSLISGKRETNDSDARSVCDALLAPEPGEMTFSINKELLAGGLVVTDEEVQEAIRFAFTRMKLVVEPGGAVALAAVLMGKCEVRDKVTGVVISGGNVSPDFFATTINQD